MEASTPLRGFLYGGLASCIAEGLTIPIDVVKIRMQLQGKAGERQYSHAGQAVRHIYRSEGILAFTKGIKPALLRQATYGSLRIGLYGPTKQALGVREGQADVRQPLAGVISGGLSAFVCTPTDLIKIRMQAHVGSKRITSTQTAGNLPRAYTGILDAARSIQSQEGWLGFYRGAGPTTFRAAVVAASELASYDLIKQSLLNVTSLSKTDTSLQMLSAACAGFISTVCSSPFDVIKSRVMSQAIDPITRQPLKYQGMIDCARISLRREGISFMWRGFWPNYMNKGPTVMLFFLLYEKISQIFEPAGRV
jgi:hypothetical protein